jgi:hypothetical protein
LESLVFILGLTRRGSTLAHGNIEPMSFLASSLMSRERDLDREEVTMTSELFFEKSNLRLKDLSTLLIAGLAYYSPL